MTTTEERQSAVADIEVTMVESHANVKVLSRKRPKQLLKIVNWLQAMCLTILHLSVTTADHMVLYTFNVKVSAYTNFLDYFTEFKKENNFYMILNYFYDYKSMRVTMGHKRKVNILFVVNFFKKYFIIL